MNESSPQKYNPRGDKGGDRFKALPQRDQLIKLADEGASLWHNLERTAFATVYFDDSAAHYPVRGRDFRLWLAHRHYHAAGGAVGGQAFEDAIRVIEAKAVYDSPRHETFLRVGKATGAIYIDLADDSWRSVMVTAGGWEIVKQAPAHFVRRRGMMSLPIPKTGGSLEELKQFLNMTETDLRLAVAWLLGAMHADGPYPILVISGEQGSAKSTAARLLRTLVDPNTAPARTAPREERDLVVAARNSFCICLDNMSDVPGWLSDGLCRLSTGGGYGSRELHTDLEEIIFEGKRPIILNGIADLTSRPDLADRSLVLNLPAIPPERRRLESDLRAQFEASQPYLLGALFDAMSAALRGREKPCDQPLARMADFARWVLAAEAEGGLPWLPGEFMAAYQDSRDGIVETTVDNDAVAQSVRDLAIAVRMGNANSPIGSPVGTWEGTASELLTALRARLDERITNSKFFPQAANGLSARLRRLAPVLRSVGVEVEIGRVGHSRKRVIRLWSGADDSGNADDLLPSCSTRP